VARAELAAATQEERLLNRELSWLAYDARVLEQAKDQSLPLLERAKNCSYASANLDEFFMVRVAGLMEQEDSGLVLRSPDGRTPNETLQEIRARTLELTAEQAKLWKRDLRPALVEQGIVVGDVEDCTKKELEELEDRFQHEVFPILTPLAVAPGSRSPTSPGCRSA